ncbi:hypothetical protein evm_003094 [Chilo suppressalis]|nr:hypothetical protein evm_003094 [Chilo suppressalis]
MNKFLLEVKALPILWDVNHMYFRDVLRKRDTWEAVAEKCDMKDGEEAKQLWSKIRCSHREAMRRRSEHNNLGEWKYEKPMEFLLTRNIENNSALNSDNVVETGLKDKFNIEVIKAGVTDERIQTLNDNPVGSSLGLTSVNLDPKKNHKNHTDMVRKNNDNRKRSLDVTSCGTDERVTENQLVISPPTNSERKNDGLAELFTCLREKTRNLPKYLQLRVQREIFESITRAEEEALTLLTSETSTDTRKRIEVKSTTKKKFVESSPQDQIYLAEIPKLVNLKTREMNISEQRQLSDDPMENFVMKVEPDEEDIEYVLSS